MNRMQYPEKLMPQGSAFLQASGQPAASNPAIHWIAWAAIGYLALFSMTSMDLVKPEYGALLAALMLPFAGKGVWRQLGASSFVRILGLFVLFALGQSLYLAAAHPVVSLQDLAAEVSKPIKLGMCGVVIGAWLSIRPDLVGVMLKLMLAGLLGQALFSLIDASWPMLLDGSLRLGFGYPENLSGAFAAIGMFAFAMLALDVARHGGRRVNRYVLLLAALVMLTALLLAGSRGAWLAAATSTPIAIGLFVRHDGWRSRRHWSSARVFGTLLITFFVIAAIMIFLAHSRMQGAGAIGAKILDGNISSIPMSPVGIRLHLLAYGTDLFMQRPLFGHGLGAIQTLIAYTSIGTGEYVPTHMHDSYLQSVVGLGLVGSAIMLWGPLALGRRVYLAYRSDLVDPRIFWLLAGSALILVQVNLFDCLAWHLMHSRIPLELLLGCAMAISLLPGTGRLARWQTSHAFAADRGNGIAPAVSSDEGPPGPR